MFRIGKTDRFSKVSEKKIGFLRKKRYFFQVRWNERFGIVFFKKRKGNVLLCEQTYI